MFANILEIEASAPTVDEAVAEALRHLGCSRAEVETTILQVPSSGFFGLFWVRPARVRARLTDRAFVARRLAKHLLSLCGFDAEIEVKPGRERLDLHIRSEDSSLIIGRHGQTLDALQSLVGALTDRQMPDRTPIVLDIGDYRARRSASLRRLARRLSAQVRRTGRPATVHPLPPEERRILHLALKDEHGIDSRSVGQGYERKMIVSSRRQ